MEKTLEKQRHLVFDADADADPAAFFLPLLNKGVEVCITTGTTIREFLCNQIGLTPDYLENRIQTVFVDGKAVDDFADTRLRPGSVLALSGAMPGLAGATLRRGGFYGGMRGEISHSEAAAAGACGQGRVTVKLFNLILKEAGPLFLKHGVRMDGGDFDHRLRSAPDRWMLGCRSVTVDGHPIDPATLPDMDWHGVAVFLTVN